MKISKKTKIFFTFTLIFIQTNSIKPITLINKTGFKLKVITRYKDSNPQKENAQISRARLYYCEKKNKTYCLSSQEIYLKKEKKLNLNLPDLETVNFYIKINEKIFVNFTFRENCFDNNREDLTLEILLNEVTPQQFHNENIQKTWTLKLLTPDQNIQTIKQKIMLTNTQMEQSVENCK